MSTSKAVMYDVGWQVMRVDMLDTWKTEYKDNLVELSLYMSAPESEGVERVRRYWRVLNYLNAIRMGFSGQGLRDHPCDVAVKEFRDAVSKGYRRLHANETEGLGRWDWGRVQMDVRFLFQNDPEAFQAVWKDLRKRERTAGARDTGLQNREELVTMLRMFEVTAKDPIFQRV